MRLFFRDAAQEAGIGFRVRAFLNNGFVAGVFALEVETPGHPVGEGMPPHRGSRDLRAQPPKGIAAAMMGKLVAQYDLLICVIPRAPCFRNENHLTNHTCRDRPTQSGYLADFHASDLADLCRAFSPHPQSVCGEVESCEKEDKADRPDAGEPFSPCESVRRNSRQHDHLRHERSHHGKQCHEDEQEKRQARIARGVLSPGEQDKPGGDDREYKARDHFRR